MKSSSSEFYEFSVGDFECYSISEGVIPRIDSARMFSRISLEEIEAGLKRYPRVEGVVEEGKLWIKNLALNFLIVKGGDQTTLIDTGYGDKKNVLENPNAAGKLIDHAKKANINPNDIDTIIITHWNSDHFGGVATKDGEVLFPNAKVVMSRIDANYIRNTVKDWALGRLEAIRDIVVFVDDVTEVCPGIRMLPAYGHTPGHMVVEIKSGDDSLLQIADCVDHYLNFEHPEWIVSWEWDGVMASRVRAKIMEESCRDRRLLHACHMPFPGLGG